MSSRSYPMYNIINSCAYAETPSKKGNKSYGVKKHSEINVKVGSSATHSNDFCTIKQSVKDYENTGWRRFQIKIDNKVVKTAYFNTKTKHYTNRKPKFLTQVEKLKLEHLV